MVMKMKCLALVAVFAIAAAGVFTGCGEDGSKDSGESVHATPEEFAQVMDDLGVDTAGIGSTPDKDANGNDVPENYNPLGAQMKALYRTSEVYVAGATPNLTTMPYDGLFDISVDPLSIIATDSTATWAADPDVMHKSVAADTDGDGIDEIVNAIFDRDAHMLTIREYKKSAGSDAFSSTNVYTVTDDSITTDIVNAERCSLDAGDIDGDGKRELLLTWNDTLRILDDADESYDVLLTKQYDPIRNTGHQYLRVRAGNLDLDTSAEIVVANGTDVRNDMSPIYNAQYFIYDDIKADPTLANPIESGDLRPDDPGPFGMIAASIAIGDFNGDKINDIAFGGMTADYVSNNINGEGVVLLTTFDENSLPEFAKISGPGGGLNGGMLMSMEAGDAMNWADDVYRGDALVVNRYCYRKIGTSWYSQSVNDFDNELLAGDGTNVDGIRIADIDADGKNEIVQLAAGYYCSNPELYKNEPAIVVSRITSSSGMGMKNVTQSITPVTYTADGANSSFCLPSTNPDRRAVKNTVVLEFAGHEVLFTKPNVVAVIASPPYWEGITQAEGSTSYGRGQTVSDSQSHSLGMSASVTFGIDEEVSFLVKLGSFKFTTKISAGFDWTTTKTREVSTSIVYTTPSGEDMVIATVIPEDIYYYKVVQSTYGESDIGRVITINKPRLPITIPITVEYYNSHNGPYHDIDSSIIPHTLGRPSSYHDFSSAMAYVDSTSYMFLDMLSGFNGWYITPHDNSVAIGQGGGSVTLTWDETVTTSNSYSMSSSVEFELENNAFGVVGGVGLELKYGFNYTLSWGSSTFIEGSVGNILPDYFSADRVFKFGLFTYTGAYNESNVIQTFPVVTYWVEH